MARRARSSGVTPLRTTMKSCWSEAAHGRTSDSPTSAGGRSTTIAPKHDKAQSSNDGSKPRGGRSWLGSPAARKESRGCPVATRTSPKSASPRSTSARPGPDATPASDVNDGWSQFASTSRTGARPRRETGDVRRGPDAAREEGAAQDEHAGQGEAADDRAAGDQRGRLCTAGRLRVLDRLVDNLELDAVGRLDDARHHPRAIDPCFQIGDPRPGILDCDAEPALFILVERAEGWLVGPVEGIELALGSQGLVLRERHLAPVRAGRGLVRGRALVHRLLPSEGQGGQHHSRAAMWVACTVGQSKQVRSEDVHFEALAHVVEKLALIARRRG